MVSQIREVPKGAILDLPPSSSSFPLRSGDLSFLLLNTPRLSLYMVTTKQSRDEPYSR